MAQLAALPGPAPALSRSRQRLWAEGGSPRLTRRSASQGKLGPEPRPRPIGGPSPLRLPGPSLELCPEQRVAETCLLGRLFAPSGWKESQRAPTPSPASPETPGEGRRARGLRGPRPQREPEWGARPGGARPSPRPGVLRGAEGGWGSPRARPVWRAGPGGRRAPSVALRNLAARSERAARAFQPARSGFAPPAKSFVCERTVRLCAGLCPPPPPALPPPLTALSPPSLLFSPLWMGNHRLQLPGAPQGVAARFGGSAAPPSHPRPPPTSPGLRPRLSGLMESFPFRPQLSPEDFDSHFPQTKCESGKLRFFGFRQWGDTAGSAAFCRIYSCRGRFHASATVRNVPG